MRRNWKNNKNYLFIYDPSNCSEMTCKKAIAKKKKFAARHIATTRPLENSSWQELSSYSDHWSRHPSDCFTCFFSVEQNFTNIDRKWKAMDSQIKHRYLQIIMKKRQSRFWFGLRFGKLQMLPKQSENSSPLIESSGWNFWENTLHTEINCSVPDSIIWWSRLESSHIKPRNNE